MGRYRPPAAKQSPYITAEGFAALQTEARTLWQQRREVVTALSAAAAEGDRSENAEYIYRKKQLRELDRRIRYLNKRMPELNVVKTPPGNTDGVFFGAWVTLEDEAGAEQTLRIVGADEFEPSKNWISVDAPMARALLQRAQDDEIEVHTPTGLRHFCIIDIRYEE